MGRYNQNQLCLIASNTQIILQNSGFNKVLKYIHNRHSPLPANTFVPPTKNNIPEQDLKYNYQETSQSLHVVLYLRYLWEWMKKEILNILSPEQMLWVMNPPPAIIAARIQFGTWRFRSGIGRYMSEVRVKPTIISPHWPNFVANTYMV